MLNDTQIRNAKATEKPLKLTDTNGLILLVTPSGSKHWRYRYRIDGKENMFALGEYCQPLPGESGEAAAIRRDGRKFTLAEARVERERCRSLVKQGIHPSKQKRIETIRRSTEANTTFKSVADAWIAENEKDWAANYTRQIKARMDADVFPHIGDLPIKQVSPALVRDVLKRIERRGAPASAKLVRTWIGGAFRYAVGELQAETDPTWVLRGSIKARPTKNIPHLAEKEIPAFLQAVDRVQAEAVTITAFNLLWLTCVRTAELRAAEWSEFDLDAGLWTVPASRMKMRVEHTVPLVPQAVAMLTALKTITGRGKFVFPGRKNREQPLTHEGIRDVIARAGYNGKFSPHGIRSTFSTFWNDRGADTEVIELVLAHKDKDKVRAVYNRAKKLNERRALMEQWANLTDTWRKGKDISSLRNVA